MGVVWVCVIPLHTYHIAVFLPLAASLWDFLWFACMPTKRPSRLQCGDSGPSAVVVWGPNILRG